MLTNNERAIILSHIILSDIQSLDKLTQRKDNLLKELQAVEREIKRKTNDADLRHNTDIRRLKGVTEKDIKRIEKYHKMYLEIEKKLKEI